MSIENPSGVKAYDSLEPWQKRVWDDMYELDKKMLPLMMRLSMADFESSTVKDQQERELLGIQLNVMKAYRAVLALRISLF